MKPKMPLRTSFIKTLLLVLGTAGLMCAAANLQAAEIQGVTIFASSGAYTNGTGPDRRPADNLVSSVGLYGDAHTAFAPGDMWWVYATNTPFSTPPIMSTNYVVFNLGGVYTVNALKVWNYNDNSAGAPAAIARGIKTGIISYSTDGVNFTTNIASQNFNEAPGTFSSFAQTITMPSPIVAQYMRIDVVTNWGATNGVGLSKVRFICNTNPPTVTTAFENYGSNQVTIHFSEPMDPNTATNKANYSIASSPVSPTISSVVMGPYPDQVILATSPLTNNSYSVSVSGVYDEALTATITNSTLPVQPEMYVWLRSDVGVQTDGSGNVTQWNDQSGYGHNAQPAVWLPPTTPATGGIENTSPPVLATGVVNGTNTFSSVQFTGSTNILGIPSDPNNPLNGDLTIFMVVDTATNTAGSYNFLMNKDGGYNAGSSNLWAGPFDFYIAHSGNKPNFLLGHGEGSATTVGTSAGIITNQFYLLTLSLTQGTNGMVYTNGAASSVATTFVSDPVADWGSPMYLGYRPNLSTNPAGGYFTPINQGFTGYMPEVMVVHGTVTPSDMSHITLYLGNKYGIHVVTQSISEQPANVTTQVGKTATFWVNVAGTQPTSFQWYSNGVSIAGATAAIYTTPHLTAAANGAQYTVSLIGGPGITSNPATLTVVPDNTPPTISSATKTTGLTNVVVVYSEYVDPSTALNAANYTLNGGANILSAAFGTGSASNQVILTTSLLNSNTIYDLSVNNVQDLFGNIIAATTVPVMPSGMVLWLRAGQGVATNASGQVDAWFDQSPIGNNALGYVYSGGNTNFRPVIGVDSIDMHSAIVFNNANYLSVPNSPSVAITSNMTVCVMYNMTDYGPYHSILAKSTSTSPFQPYSFDIYTGNSANYQGILRFGRGNSTSSTFVGSSTVASAGNPHLHTIVMNGTSVNYTVDGVADGNATLTQATSDGGQPLIIGSRDSFDIFMSGDMQEVMIFSNAVSSTDIAAVQNYVGTTYYPLTVTQPPVNVTTNVGATATFSVVANQGSAQLAYQWMENGTNIPGATSASYTTPVLAPGDNGETFSVVLGTPGFSTTNSGPVTLTVLNNPPTILSAGQAIWSSHTIVIVFSEGVLPSTATNIANYSLSGATILSAAIGSSQNQVVLTTSTLTQGTSYSLTVQNLSNLYGVTMPSPIAVSTGIYPPATVLWVKAGVGVTADGSGNVSQWNDLSGNNNNLANSSGPPFDPLLATNSSGYPVIRFNATNESFMDAADVQSLEITNDMTVFAVMNFATLAGGTNGEILAKTANNNIAAPYDYNVNASSVLLNRGNGTTAAFVASTKAPSVGVTHLLAVVMQGTNVTHLLDGSLNGTGYLSTTIADPGLGSPLYIGTRYDQVNRFSGDMSELILIGSALQSNDVVSVENYLSAEYGLQPPVNANPTNIVFSVANNQLTLSWPADHTGWTLQDQTNNLSVGISSNWVNVAGSTGTNQVVVPINITNGGVFYRLIYTP